MTSLKRYEPFRMLRRDLDRLFEDLLPSIRDDEAVPMWSPRVDLSETDAAIIARIDLPGMKPEDIQVDVQDYRLTVRGERKSETKEEDENFVHIERYFGSFYRTLALPENVVTDKVEAKFEDGVLVVNVPKAQQKKAKRIAVKPAAELETA